MPDLLRCSGAAGSEEPKTQFSLISNPQAFHVSDRRSSERKKRAPADRWGSGFHSGHEFIQVYSPSLQSVWLRYTPSAVSPPRSRVSAGSWWISGSIRLPSPHLSGPWAPSNHCTAESLALTPNMSLPSSVYTHARARASSAHTLLHTRETLLRWLTSSLLKSELLRMEETFKLRSRLRASRKSTVSEERRFYFESWTQIPMVFLYDTFEAIKSIFHYFQLQIIWIFFLALFHIYLKNNVVYKQRIFHMFYIK